jgi:hypothetical protein
MLGISIFFIVSKITEFVTKIKELLMNLNSKN